MPLKLRTYSMIFKQIFWVLPFVILVACANSSSEADYSSKLTTTGLLTEHLEIKGEKVSTRLDSVANEIIELSKQIEEKMDRNKSKYSDLYELTGKPQASANHKILALKKERLERLLTKLFESKVKMKLSLARIEKGKPLNEETLQELKILIQELEQEIKYAEKVTSQETVSLHI